MAFEASRSKVDEFDARVVNVACSSVLRAPTVASTRCKQALLSDAILP